MPSARLPAAFAALVGGLVSGSAGADDDCTRAMPSPIVDATAPGVARHSYSDEPDRQGREVVTLKDGLELTIKHSGCAHYVLAIEFAVSPPAPDSGIALLKEAKLLVERLSAAAPDAQFRSFIKVMDKAIAVGHYVSGDELTEISGYSWIYVDQELGHEPDRKVTIVYDVAL